ncbi:MAG: hypothetical protein IJ746_02460 [Ruminococcus sp.]|nr:hypothetical protein [Ruminococcus sp.]
MKQTKKKKIKLTKREKIFLLSAVVLLIVQLFIVIRTSDRGAVYVKSYIGEDAPQRYKNAVLANLAVVIPIWAVFMLAMADLFIKTLEARRQVKEMVQKRRELAAMLGMQEGEETSALNRIGDGASGIISIIIIVSILLFGIIYTYDIFTNNELVYNGVKNMSRLDRDIKEKATLTVEGEADISQRVYSGEDAEIIRAPMYLRLETDDGRILDLPISGSDSDEIRRAFGWTEEQIKYPFAYKRTGRSKLGRMRVEYYENTLMIVRYEVPDSTAPEETATPEMEQEPKAPAAEPEPAPDSAADSPDSAAAPNGQQEREALIDETNERYMAVISCLKSNDIEGLRLLISSAAGSEPDRDGGGSSLDRSLDRLCEFYGGEDAELEPFATFTDFTAQDGKRLLETARYIVTGGRRLYMDIYFCLESSEEGDIGIYRISLSDLEEGSPTYGEKTYFNGSYAIVGHY